MSNIRVDVDYTIKDGTEIKFKSPVNCSQVTGLIVYYPGVNGNTVSKVFFLSDAHGNNVGDIDHLFAENVVVKVILDVTTSMAFVQNADTNAYLEAQFAKKAPASGFVSTNSVGSAEALDAWIDELVAAQEVGTRKTYYTVLRWYANAALPTGRWSITIHKPDVADEPTWAGVTATVIASQRIHHLQRELYDGTWLPWEWENPNMELGKEYRTTERHQNKAVYTKLIDCGVLPNNSVKYVDHYSGKVIRCLGTTTNGTTLPLLRKDNPIYLASTSATINIETTNDQSDTSAFVQIWYTKD